MSLPIRLASLVLAYPWRFAGVAGLYAIVHTLPLISGLMIQRYFDGLAAGAMLEALFVPLVLFGIAESARITAIVAVASVETGARLSVAFLLMSRTLAPILSIPRVGADSFGAGEVVNRLRDDAELTGDLARRTVGGLGRVVFAFTALAILLRTNSLLTLVVILPIVGIVMAAHTARVRVEKYRTESRQTTSAIGEYLTEALRGAQAIQLANAQRAVLRRVAELNGRRMTAAVRDRVFTEFLNSVFGNTVTLGTGAILLLGGLAIRAQSFSVGDFALFIYFLGWVTETTLFFALTAALFRQAGVSMNRLSELASQDPKVRSHSVASRSGVRDASGVDELQKFAAKDLSYRYPESSLGLQAVNFAVEPGNILVVTGRTGAGKTTLLRTLLGLHPSQGGDLSWNGSRILDVWTFMRQQRVGYTPQVPALFTDTIRNNMLLGFGTTDREIDAAIWRSVMDDDIGKLPLGLDTIVGTHGRTLSGGEGLRLAAARMFVRAGELILLDDLSSALDAKTEELLWARLTGDRRYTVIAVSQSRAAFQVADAILVLERGQPSICGSLNYLLGSSTEMQRLWSTSRILSTT